MVQIVFYNNRIDRERMIIQNILDKNNIDGLTCRKVHQKYAIPESKHSILSRSFGLKYSKFSSLIAIIPHWK